MRKEKSHERTRGSNPRAGRGQGPAGVHIPADRGDDGGVRPVLRRIPLRPRRAVRGEDGPSRSPGPGGAGRRRREDRRSAAAPGGRRPAEVPAWGEALRRAAVRAGAERAARAGAAGEERPRSPAADGETGGQDPAPPSPEAREPGADGRADALPPSPLVRQAEADGQGQHQRKRQRESEVPAQASPRRASWQSRSPSLSRRRSPSPRRPWPTTTGGTRSTSR